MKAGSRASLRTLLASALLVAGLAGTASAQSGVLQRRLAKATTVSCTFSAMATATWDGGAPGAKTAATKLTVTFTNINADEGSADIASAFGSFYIVVRYSNDYLHLTQMHRDGPLYTTTVLAKETKDGRLIAVHTRHEYMAVNIPGFTSSPEIYVGDCAVS